MKPHKHRPMKLELDGKQRLNKILAAAGYGSRRSVDELIEQGRVEVNGETCSRLGTQVDPTTDKISVDGELIKVGRPMYYAVNKPIGVVCTNRDPQGRPRVVDLVPPGPRLFSIGRLDRNSTGLILLTNDGTIAQRLTHPKYGVRKTYRVLVAGFIDRDQLGSLKKGVYLAEGKAKADDATIRKTYKNSTEIEIVLSEGKNREIRRVLARIGHKVLALQRTSVGPIKLANLAEGEYRPLTPAEISSLKNTAVRLSEGKNGVRGERDEMSRSERDAARTKRTSDDAQVPAAKPKKVKSIKADGQHAPDVPEQLVDDARFVTDPSQIPTADWEDDFEAAEVASVEPSAEETTEELSPELAAELQDFLQNSNEDDVDIIMEDDDSIEDKLTDNDDLESILAELDDDDDLDDDDLDEMDAETDHEIGDSDDSDPFTDSDEDELLSGLADAILVRDVDSSKKGRIIADGSDSKPARKPSDKSNSRGNSPYGQFNKPKSGGFKGRRDSERGERSSANRNRSSGGAGERGSDRRSSRPSSDARSDRGSRPAWRPDDRRSDDSRRNESSRDGAARGDRRPNRYNDRDASRSNARGASDRRERGASERGSSDRREHGPFQRRERASEGGEQRGAGRTPRPTYGRSNSPYRSERGANERGANERGANDRGERSSGPRGERGSPYRSERGANDRGEQRPTRGDDQRSSGRSDRGNRNARPRRDDRDGPRSDRPQFGKPRGNGSNPWKQGGPKRSGDGPSSGGRSFKGKPKRRPPRDE